MLAVYGNVVAGAIILFVVALFYIYAPQKIRSSQLIARLGNHFNVQESALPSELVPAFRATADELGACGFELIDYVEQKLIYTGQSSYAAFWRHPKQLDSAQILVVKTPHPLGGETVTSSVSFGAFFTDHTDIDTSTSRSATIFPPNPKTDPVNFAGVDDIALLYQIHRARLVRTANRRNKTLAPFAAGGAEFLNQEHKTTYERLMNAGYYYLDEQRDVYQMTLKGAYIMTWRLLPPLKQIRQARRRWKANRTLHDCGFPSLRELQRRSGQEPFSSQEIRIE